MQRLNLMTADEAAEALGVSEQTLASWRRTGRHDLKYYKLGRMIRYDADDIHDLVESSDDSEPDDDDLDDGIDADDEDDDDFDESD